MGDNSFDLEINFKHNPITMKVLNQKSQQLSNLKSTLVKNRYNLLNLLIITYFLSILALFSSCSSDDGETPVQDSVEQPVETPPQLPTLSLQSGESDLFLGVVGGASESLLNHTVKANVPEGLTSLKISRVLAGETEEYVTISEGSADFTKGMTSITYQLDYIFNEKDVEQELYFIAEVLDEEGQTTSLKFAEAWVKMPLIKSTFSLHSSKNGGLNPQYLHYLFIKGDEIKGVPNNKAVLDENDKNIAAILSFNDDSEFYIASPTDIDEGILTDAMPSIAKTKFKYDVLSDQPLSSVFNELSVHEIEKNYEDLLFSEKDERIEKLTVGNRFYFKTADGRIAIVQLNSMQDIGVYNVFYFDILITQNL